MYEITPKKGSYGSPRKQTLKASNLTKQNLSHDDFTYVFSVPVKCKIYFLGSYNKLSLVLFHKYIFLVAITSKNTNKKGATVLISLHRKNNNNNNNNNNDNNGLFTVFL